MWNVISITKVYMNMANIKSRKTANRVKIVSITIKNTPSTSTRASIINPTVRNPRSFSSLEVVVVISLVVSGRSESVLLCAFVRHMPGISSSHFISLPKTNAQTLLKTGEAKKRDYEQKRLSDLSVCSLVDSFPQGPCLTRGGKILI